VTACVQGSARDAFRLEQVIKNRKICRHWVQRWMRKALKTTERAREWSKVARFVVCAPKSTRVTQKHVTNASLWHSAYDWKLDRTRNIVKLIFRSFTCVNTTCIIPISLMIVAIRSLFLLCEDFCQRPTFESIW